MYKRIAILISAFIMVTITANATIAREKLLKDGLVLRDVDGQLIGPDSNDVWFFELNSDVNDYETVVKAGTKLELLPSSGLEKMTASVKMRSEATYRLLDGRITKYKGRNYIFPKYFLPLSKTKEPETQVPPESKQGEEKLPEPDIAISEPNDILPVPPEIIEKLKASKKEIADSNELGIQRTGYMDSVLVDRTAFLDEGNDGRPIFVLDALGQNLQHVSLRLLPCEVLELTERRQSRMTGPIRLQIAGIKTEYKGHSYLLLHKATRIYNYGNFGR